MIKRKNIETIKDKFNDSKMIIYNIGNLLYGKTIKESIFIKLKSLLYHLLILKEED